MHISESSEDYLERILMLSEKLPVVRSVDIANDMGYKKSSVSVAMKNLRQSGKITVTPAGYIYLTPEGRKIASMIYERHKCFSKWLKELGIDETTAANDACHMEHALSEQSFEAIKEYISRHPVNAPKDVSENRSENRKEEL